MANISIIGPTHPYRGGIAHHTTLLAKALGVEHAVSVYNFTRLYPAFLFPGKTQLDESDRPIGVDSLRTVDSLNPVTWWKTGRLIAAGHADRAVFQWWQPFFAPAYRGICSSLARRSSRTRKVFVCHNVIPHESRAVDRALLSLALRGADAFVVQSASELGALAELAPSRPAVVCPHPNYGVFRRPDASREAARRALGLEGDVVLFFGYVRAYKGLRVAIEALAQVVARRPVTLVVAGEFYEDKGPYLELIQRLGLGERVKIFDRYIPNEQVANYFEAADLVVQPYVTATQSGISQIAFAFGKPVLATAVGGLPDVITDGKTGFLVQPQDPAAVARAMLQFFEERMGPEMERHVLEDRRRFSWEALAEAVATV